MKSESRHGVTNHKKKTVGRKYFNQPNGGHNSIFFPDRYNQNMPDLKKNSAG